VFGAIIATLISIPLRAIAGPMQSAMLSRALEHASNLPPDVRAQIETMTRGGGGMVLLLIGFLIRLVIASVVTTLGGLLGAMMFRKDVPPIAPPAGPPPVPPPLPPTV